MGFCSEMDFEDFRCNGHHYIETPDGYVDDYDSAISRYIALCRGSNGECIDSNGSEASPSGLIDDLTVVYDINEHYFEGDIKVDGEFVTHGKLVRNEDGEVVYKIDRIEGYDLKPKKKEKKMSKINEKDIAKRWTERIVANGWQNEGRSGAMAYLEKYGRNISCEKVQAIADYARKQGCEDFAVAMEQTMK